MNPLFYTISIKVAFLAVIISSILVIINAALSAKALGGTLGQSLKKIAAGTTIHIILFATYTLLERGSQGVLDDEQIRLFFMIAGILGSVLLLTGFFQLYNIARRLKLFTL
jgi:hypothetical protein